MEPELDYIAKIIVDSAFKVHSSLGPGLLERVYELCLTHELSKAGLTVKRQLEIPIIYDGIKFDEGFRLDLLVEEKVIVELKAVDLLNPLWEAQIISHLKLMNKKLGFLITLMCHL